MVAISEHGFRVKGFGNVFKGSSDVACFGERFAEKGQQLLFHATFSSNADDLGLFIDASDVA